MAESSKIEYRQNVGAGSQKGDCELIHCITALQRRGCTRTGRTDAPSLHDMTRSAQQLCLEEPILMCVTSLTQLVENSI
jgi:hypothetical protein